MAWTGKGSKVKGRKSNPYFMLEQTRRMKNGESFPLSTPHFVDPVFFSFFYLFFGKILSMVWVHKINDTSSNADRVYSIRTN